LCTGTNDCIIDCTDGETVGNEDVGGYDLTFSGDGVFYVKHQIENYETSRISSDTGCRVIVLSGEGGKLI
jgi:hypothetical protein